MRSVATRIALATAALVLLVAAGVYTGLLSYQRQALLRAKSESAQMVVTLFAELSSAPVLFTDDQALEDSVGYLRTNPEVQAAAVFARMADGTPGAALATWVKPGAGAAAQVRLAKHEVGSLRVASDALDVSRWIRDPAGQPIGVAWVRFSLARENRSFALLSRRTQQISFAIAAGLLLLLLLLARVYVIGPLRALHAAVGALSSGTSQTSAFLRRLPLTASDELGDLSRGFVSMTEAIARREAAIARQNGEMRLVLESVGQGFLVLDGRGVIEGQHSAVVEQWFGRVPRGSTLWDYLRPHDPEYAEWLSLAWSNIGAPFMPLELCVEQMPKTFSAGDRHYEAAYRARREAEGALANMVVVISDVTELRRREQAEREQRELVGVFGALIRDRAGFAGFCEEASALLKRMAEASAEAGPELRQALHTLKGNAAVFQLSELSALCDQVEARCAEEGRAPRAEEVARMSEAFARGTRAVQPFLGSDSEAAAVHLQGEDYAAIEQALSSGESGRAVLARLAQATAEPAEQVFGRFAARLSAMARRLGKVEIVAHVRGAGVRFPRSRFAPLWPVMVHVLRNIADHGLETAWERERAGKPERANVWLSARVEGDVLQLEFRDDGRGVDWERVRARARERGLLAHTREELSALLLQPGFSTLDKPSAISGRGVGLSAVASEVAQRGGRLTLVSEPQQGTTVTIVLPRALLA